VNLAAQIQFLLDATSTNPGAWTAIRRSYDADISCGVFMESSSEWFELPSELLGRLSEKQLVLGFDLYDQVKE
jgi:hypothetical protein